MKSVLFRGPSDGAVESLPFPLPGPGSVTVRILHCLVHNNAARQYRGEGQIKPSYPSVFGGYAVGRVAAIGPDTTAMKPGQLVIVDPFVHARDDPDVVILWGVFDGLDERTKRFTKTNWRDGCWAEYARAPLENTWPLDEDLFIGKLGLQIQDLVHLGPLVVVYSGLRKINVQAGETIVIAPATGVFSGGAISVARAMGVNVIAGGRNAEGLTALEARYPDIKTVRLSGGSEDTAALEALGPIDAFIDVAPPEATDSAYLGSCMLAVRREGRVCLMGGRGDASLPYPYSAMVFKDLTIRGSWMYEPQHVRGLLKLVASGKLNIGAGGGMEVIGSYPLDKFEEAMEHGTKCSAGKIVVLSP